MSRTEVTTVEVTLKDLENWRTLLLSVQTFLQARDLMNAQLNMAEPRWGSMTQETGRVLDRVNGLMSDALLKAHDEEDGDDAEPEDSSS